MKIGLIPLDERPVNTRYPQMLAAIGEAEVLSNFRTPANGDRLVNWLIENGGQWDALIVSCEMLGYGGLIASRTSDEPGAAITSRLETLRTLKSRHPDLRILGFNIVPVSLRLPWKRTFEIDFELEPVPEKAGFKPSPTV